MVSNHTQNIRTTSGAPTRPARLPWDTEPRVDHQAAAQRALAAAQYRRTDPNSPAVKAYAKKAFDAEIDKLKSTAPGERNTQLFKSGANLFELVASEALDEDTVRDALRDACRDNGLEPDDGGAQIAATIKSARQHGFDSPRDLANVGNHNGFHVAAETPAKSVDLAGFTDLERGFWTSRDSLQHIYLAALSRMCPPWAVLGCCAAIALASVRPHCTLPPIICGTGTLNWFCAIAEKSGGGKSGSLAVARELVKYPVRRRNLGSGEGVIDAYVKPANKETGEPSGRYESVMFVADEIDMLATLSSRTGNTLMHVLKSAVTGDTLGFSYRQASDAHLEAHSYRMTLVANVQAGRAGALLDDKDSGTLQRFMWFPATDPRVTDQPPAWPGQLDITSPSKWQYRIEELPVPYEAIELIRNVRARRMRGETDILDSHALYIREKFAYALAVLDGRNEMSYDDWRLAGIACRVSDFTRSWVESELQNAREQEATKRGQLQGVSLVAADEGRSAHAAIRGNEAYNKALSLIEKAGCEGITNRELVRRVGRLAKYLPGEHGVLTRLFDQKLIEQRESTNTTGPKSVVWFAAHS